jgi:SAM-dependent methyltransferase
MRPGEETFHGWYASGIGSGPGSHPDYTRTFRGVLERFLVEHEIRSVLDYGCGDWQWAKMVQWGERSYLGLDIVPHLIDRLRREHGSDRIRFDVVVDPDRWTPPAVDLVLCKDVLQHLSTAEAVSLSTKLLKAAKHVLFINDRPRAGQGVNIDAPRGGYRPLDLSKPPFHLQGRIIHEFQPDHPTWDKIAFWVQGSGTGAESVPLSQDIPRVLHHVWPGSDEFTRTRGDFHGWRLSWLHHHPDWSFRFWRLGSTGDPRVDEVLARKDLTVVVKSDVLRWQVMLTNGGVYVDTDMECLRPLDANVLATGKAAVLARDPFPWRLCAEGPRPGGPSPSPLAHLPPWDAADPAFIAAPKGSEFARLVLERVLRTVQEQPARELNMQPHLHTGPLLVSHLWRERPNLIEVLPEWAFYTGHPGRHYGSNHYSGQATGGWVKCDQWGDGRAPEVRPRT